MNIHTQNKIELALAFIPGSITEKKLSNAKAIENVELAKSFNRPVRRAKQGESEFSRNMSIEKVSTEKEVLSTAEVKKLLGVSQATVFKYRDEGLLPLHSKIKTAQYFLRSDALKIIDNQENSKEGLLSMSVAAKECGMTVHAFRYNAYKGHVPYTSFGLRKYFKKEDLDIFVVKYGYDKKFLS